MGLCSNQGHQCKDKQYGSTEPREEEETIEQPVPAEVHEIHDQQHRLGHSHGQQNHGPQPLEGDQEDREDLDNGLPKSAPRKIRR